MFRPIRILHQCILLVCLSGAVFAAAAVAEEANIAVLGRVQTVYLNTKISDPVYVLQLEAEETKLIGDSARSAKFHLPAAHEIIFVVCEPGSNGLRTRLTIDDLPQAGNQIRALLTSNILGKWQPAGAQWFEHVAQPATTTAQASPPQKGSDDSPQVDLRGMTCEGIILEGHLAFAVKSVAPTGPAHDAGFQVGDIVVAVDGKPLNSIAALKEFADSPTPLRISVVDVNSGRLAAVDLAVAQQPPTPREPGAGSPTVPAVASTDRLAQSLGIEATVSRIGFRKSALAVSKIDPRGAAAEAGVEIGDVILAVDNQPTEDVDAMAAALPSGGGRVTLLIRDVRGGEDVPVEVTCRPSAATTATAAPSRREAQSVGPGDALGLTTALAFYQGEAAVRVTGVQPDSPAARTGIQPGWLILAAGGKPVLHPDELKLAEQSTAGPLRLRVADPRSGREAEVDVAR